MSILLTVCIVIMTGLSVSADDTDSTKKCGENVYWSFEDGTLTVSGVGEMYDYSASNMPWTGISNKIKTVTIEDGVTSIGEYSFYSTSVEKLLIGDSVTVINKGAFEWCSSLSYVHFGSSLQRIEKRAFSTCNSLKNIVFPDSLQYIGDQSFFSSKISYLVIPDNVEEVGENAFYNNSLINVSAGENTKVLGYAAFYSNSNLQSIYIPYDDVSIDSNTFCNDYDMTIYCHEGSNAETFAKNYSYNYQIIDENCDHNYATIYNFSGLSCTDVGTKIDMCTYCKKCIVNESSAGEHSNFYYLNIQDATCSNTGYTGDKYCGVCKQLVEKGTVVPSKDHANCLTVNYKEATCAENGYTGDKYCTDCGDYIQYGQEVPATGHTPSEWIVDKEATESEDGIEHIECKTCHALLEIKSIPKTAKDEVKLSFWQKVINFFKMILGL